MANPIPNYVISQSPIDKVNEGADIVTTVQTTNLLAGTKIWWSAVGEGIDASDFGSGSALKGQGWVDLAGKLTITHKIALDSKTEGEESLQIQLFSDILRKKLVGNSPSITLKDVSLASPTTYAVTQAASGSVNEGSNLTTTIQTTNLAAGTKVYWSASGANIEAKDFDPNQAGFRGEGIVGADGKFSLVHALSVDNKTEGDETLQFKLFSDSSRTVQVGTTASTLIRDTSPSLPPANYVISQSPTSNINEGSDLTTTVQTTNLAQGTKIYWSAGGSGIDALDFISTGASLAGEATVDENGSFSLTHTIASDSSTEGDESLQLQLFSDVSRTKPVGNTISTIIEDTSLTSPSAFQGIQASPAYTLPPTEGAGEFTASIFFSLGKSTSVSSLEGRQVYWKLSGIQDSDLAYGYGMAGSGTIVNGKLEFNISLVQDDIVEKEKLSISVYADPAFSTQLGQELTSDIGGDIGSSRAIATRSTKLDANTSQLSLSGNYAINGAGNTLDNLIEGNDKANVLDGGKGDDVLVGGLGDDTYIVDSAYDVIVENPNSGTDLISSSINWTLGANIENLMLTGGAAINGKGNADDNTITGNLAKNILDGGSGNDLLIGGAGDDTYIVDSAGDIIKEQLNQGSDSVESSVDWALGANLENLYLKGTASINGTGNSGNNIMIGNMANNILDGKRGADILSGMGGADIFYFSSKEVIGSTGATHITDFNAAEGDLIRIKRSAFGFGSGTNISVAKITSSTELKAALGTASAFVYDSSTGNLHWNQNGAIAGAGAGGVFVVLDNRADLDNSSISLV